MLHSSCTLQPNIFVRCMWERTIHLSWSVAIFVTLPFTYCCFAGFMSLKQTLISLLSTFWSISYISTLLKDFRCLRIRYLASLRMVLYLLSCFRLKLCFSSNESSNENCHSLCELPLQTTWILCPIIIVEHKTNVTLIVMYFLIMYSKFVSGRCLFSISDTIYNVQ